MDTEIILLQPDEIEQKERERALASYFMMFISSTIGLPLPFINLIASWVYYSYTKKTSRFVKFHSFQSLISQLPITILNTLLVVWVVALIFNNLQHLKDALLTSTFIGFLVTVALVNLIYIVFSIVAAIRAYQGRMYYFPFFGNLAFREAYMKEQTFTEKHYENKPPAL